jgi:hypothetical protein
MPAHPAPPFKTVFFAILWALFASLLLIKKFPIKTIGYHIFTRFDWAILGYLGESVLPTPKELVRDPT